MTNSNVLFYNANIDIEVGLEKQAFTPLPGKILILAYLEQLNIDIDIADINSVYIDIGTGPNQRPCPWPPSSSLA